MPTGVRRLNRRRYRESISALKDIIGDKKTPALRKLRAIDTLLGIYDRHDRTEAAKEARRKAADAPVTDGRTEEADGAPERLQESVDEFLRRIGRNRTEETEQVDE